MVKPKVSLRVLIVEDQFLVASELEDIIDQLGHEHIETVTNADDALEAVDDEWPDIILMDIFIDGIRDGVETAEAIRQKGMVPILFLTDRLEDQVYERAKRVPDAWFLNKPVSVIQLGRTIDQYLKSREERVEATPAPAAEPPKAAVASPLLKDSIIVKDGYSKVRLRLDEIVYLEGSQGRYLNYFTTRREQPFQESNSLSKRMEMLTGHEGAGQIMQISRAHAVNLHYVEQLEDNSLVMRGGQRLRVGSTYIERIYPYFEE